MELDAFLAAFRDDWVKAGPPTPATVIAMVNEIERLRQALSLREGGAVAELARGIQIAHTAWLAMGAPGAWRDAEREPAKTACPASKEPCPEPVQCETRGCLRRDPPLMGRT